MDPRCAVTNYITSEWSALINIRVHFHRRETLHHEPDPPLSPPAFAAHHPAKQADRHTDRRTDRLSYVSSTRSTVLFACLTHAKKRGAWLGAPVPGLICRGAPDATTATRITSGVKAVDRTTI